MKNGTLPELLEWAFGEELPKGGGEAGLNGYASAWGRISGLAELGTLVDFHSGRREGMSFVDDSEPHPAALVLGEAVAGLRNCTLRPNPDFDGFFPDWPKDARRLLTPLEAQIMRQVDGWAPARQASHLLSLVITSAVLKRRPGKFGWQGDGPADPATRMVCGSRGAPKWFVAHSVIDRVTGRTVIVERDGYDSRRGRPFAGAYRKWELKHSPMADMWSVVDVTLLRQAWVAIFGQLDCEALAAAGVRLAPWAPFLQEASCPVLLETDGQAVLSAHRERVPQPLMAG